MITWLTSTTLGKLIATFFISMAPIIELRGGLPYGRVVRKYSAIGLCILVAIPLPGTGAWTGALVAAVLDMRLKSAIPSIFLGVCIAAAIMTAVTFGLIHIF